MSPAPPRAKPGNKFLSHIRETDAIAEVVRCFEDSNITHVDGSIDPFATSKRSTPNSAWQTWKRCRNEPTASPKSQCGDKDAKAEYDVLKKVLACLENGEPARKAGLTKDDLPQVKDLNLLTLKPIIYIANVAEDEAGNPDANPNVKRVEEYAAQEGAQVVAVSAKIEAEIAELPADEAAVFLEELGLPESGLDKLIKASYALLG